MPRSEAIIKGKWPKVGHTMPSGAEAKYRFFRGMDCVDHLTSILFEQVKSIDIACLTPLNSTYPCLGSGCTICPLSAPVVC
jgi:hypothetical protein